MKKILAIALVIVMMMSMSVTAFAAEDGQENIDSATGYTFPYEKGIDVSVRLDSDGDKIPDLDDPTNENERVIVDLSWTDMEFLYSKSWDAYKGETTGEWVESDQYISVTNRSIYEVTAEFSYTQIDTDYNIEFSVRETEDEGVNVVRKSNAEFDGTTLTLANPTTVTLDKDAYGDNILPWGEIAVNLADGAKIPEVDSKAAVGTITVTIAANGFVPPTPPASEITPYVIYGDDREDWSETEVTISADQEIEFLISCYACAFDDIQDNDRYTVKAVSCEATPDAVEVANTYNIKFNQTGTFDVTITLRCENCQMDINRNIKVTVE